MARVASFENSSVTRRKILADEEGGESDEEGVIMDTMFVPPINLEEDTYGMTVCSLARDTYFIARHESGHQHARPCARWLRLSTTFGLCLATIGVQVALLYYVKVFVCAKAVTDIRGVYSKYELLMYGEANCFKTEHGSYRGDLKKYNPSLDDMQAKFHHLGEEFKEEVCHIPLSQPCFFGVVLLIWSSACWLEVRKACNLLTNVLMLPRVSTMADALGEGDDSKSRVDANIEGLTLLVKVFFAVVSAIRICVTLYLLWVGCRLLLATNDFAELILNAVALEFILLLKEGFYHAFVPTRNKLDIQVTTIAPQPKHIHPELAAFTGAFGSFFLLVAWVVLYVLYLQEVLPGYQWDLREVCTTFVLESTGGKV